jgi:hypothetical protein
MTKTTFLELAASSLLFAQCRAESAGVTPAQIDLYTLAAAQIAPSYRSSVK